MPDQKGDLDQRRSQRKSLNRYDFNPVFTPAWLKAMSPANIQSGFKQCGLWPFSRIAVVLPCERISQSPQGN